jgi:hypothetical protein
MSSKTARVDTRLAIAFPTFRNEPIRVTMDPPQKCLYMETVALKVAFQAGYIDP